jgi:hypothetical protein
MPPAGFELAKPESERPQTHALDRAVTVISPIIHVIINRIQLQKKSLKVWWLCES